MKQGQWHSAAVGAYKWPDADKNPFELIDSVTVSHPTQHKVRDYGNLSASIEKSNSKQPVVHFKFKNVALRRI